MWIPKFGISLNIARFGKDVKPSWLARYWMRSSARLRSVMWLPMPRQPVKLPAAPNTGSPLTEWPA